MKKFKEIRENINEISRSMTPMKNKFGARNIDAKKMDAYKKFAKSKNIDDSSIRMAMANPNAGESKKMMKNKDFAKAMKMYKDASLDESIDDAAKARAKVAVRKTAEIRKRHADEIKKGIRLPDYSKKQKQNNYDIWQKW